MQFVVGTITRCRPNAGAQHFQIPITIGGETHTLHTSPTELQSAGPATFAEGRNRVVERLRSALLEEADVPDTFAELKTALEGRTFSI